MSKPGTDPFERALREAEDTASLERGAAGGADAEAVALLRDATERWAASRLDAARSEREGGISAELRREAAELGLFGLTLPSCYGGLGLTSSGAGEIVRTVMRHDRGMGVAIGLHCGLGCCGLVRFGSQALRDRYLPALASGRSIAAFAATEPGAGSDLAKVASVGRHEPDGSLCVDGQKAYVTNAGFADVFTVLVRTPPAGRGRGGMSLVLLDRDSHGLVVGAEEDKLGLRSSSTAPLYLTQVRVDRDRLIGEPGRAMLQMPVIMALGRLMLAWGCLGSAETAYRAAARHVHTRSQFGRPIAEFGQVREKIVAMRAGLLSMESVVSRASGAAVGDADCAFEGIAAKLFCSETAWRIADDAVQLHGGAGFLEPTGVARVLRDLRIFRIFEGSNEVLRCHLVAAAIRQLREEPAGHPIAALGLPHGLARSAADFDRALERVREVVSTYRHVVEDDAFERQRAFSGLSRALVALYCWLALLLRAREAGFTNPRGALAGVMRFALASARREVDDGLAAAADRGAHALVRTASDEIYTGREGW